MQNDHRISEIKTCTVIHKKNTIIFEHRNTRLLTGVSKHNFAI